VDWDLYYGGEKRHKVILPTYPFERQRYWVEPSSVKPVDVGRNADRSQWFYVPSWQRTHPVRITHKAEREIARSRWVIFGEGAGLRQQLASLLQRCTQDVIVVSAGDSFGRPASGVYVIDPLDSAQHITLIEELRRGDETPTRFVYLCDPSADTGAIGEWGFYGLLYLTQALAKQKVDKSVAISVITGGALEVTGEEELKPLQATVVGLCKTIQQELGIVCRAIDVEQRDNANEIAKIAERIIAETAVNNSESLVAHRGGYRWVQNFRHVHLRPSGEPPLRNGGVYLLIGGLGRIGLELAQHVADHVKAKLVLVSASGLPPRDRWTEILNGRDGTLRHKVEQVLILERAGSEVTTVAADSNNFEEMKKVITEVQHRYGRLAGVFHSAGLKVDGTLETIGHDECERQLKIKIDGLRVLEQVLEGMQLEFVFVVSSLGSVLGVLGYPAYAAAHAFVDSFVYKHNRTDATPWISVNFDNWTPLDDAAAIASGNVTTFSMSSEEGREVTGHVLGSGGSTTQILVSTGDLQARMNQWVPNGSEWTQSTSSLPEAALSTHARPNLQNVYVAPRNATEQRLAQIWQQLLGTERVGVEDNFFELGGDSVISLQVVGQARQAGLQLRPKQVFEHQTIAELACLLGDESDVQAREGASTGPVPLTPIQHWFFEQDFPEPSHFNQAVLLELRRSMPVTVLEKAVLCIVEHHDCLRLRYHRSEQGWRSEIVQAHPLPVRRVDVSGVADEEKYAAMEMAANEAHASLNITAGPMCAAVLFDAGDKEQLLLIVHHLAVDLVSWPILIEDVSTACQQLSEAREVHLAPPTDSFKSWGEKLRAQVAGGMFGNELQHWLSETREHVAKLPVDIPADGHAVTEATARIVSCELEGQDVLALLHEMPRSHGVHVQDVLLTAVAEALTLWTGADNLLLDVEGLGRDGVGEDVDYSRTVGWFTTMYPVLLEIVNTDKPLDALHAVKATLRGIPNHGIGYGALRYLSDDAKASKLSDLPQAEVNFLYQGQRSPRPLTAGCFDVAHGPLGALHSPRTPLKYRLSLNTWIEADRLHMDWIYSSQVYRRETVERLVQQFIGYLQSIIAASRTSEQTAWRSEAMEFDWDSSDVKDIAAAIEKNRTN
jgi:non-ribosomal peptide synthase protein (TIGR01720 family)